MTFREQLFDYVKKKYKADPEYLWKRFPDYAVFRHTDNEKWFGLVMDIKKRNLGLDEDDPVDVLNVKLSDPLLVDMLIRQPGYFRGYHISRGNWVSILLDGSVPFDDICRWLEESYLTTASKKKKQKIKHKGIMCAPFIGRVSIAEYLPAGQIEQVLCDGENYGGARPCHYEWVKSLHDECAEYNVTFVFCGTGRRFVNDSRTYKLEGSIQSEQAYKSGLRFQGKPIEWKLTDDWGYPISEDSLYMPYYGERCQNCGMKFTCNGCSRCGKCS